MIKTVFDTRSELDLSMLTVFGVSEKPNTTSPIGFFGTGLKYAIAVLLRNNIPVQMMIGDTEYEFYVKGRVFRTSAEHQIVHYRKRTGLVRKWFSQALPFTLRLGVNWDLWMAYRELESNTIDEQGVTWQTDEDVPQKSGHTRIIVHGEDFAAVHRDRNKIFLPNALRVAESHGVQVQIIPAESEFMYYRGLRVTKLPERSSNTYNILCSLDLTEDRTIKSQWIADLHVMFALGESTDEDVTDRAAKSKGYEKKKLDWKILTRDQLRETMRRSLSRYAEVGSMGFMAIERLTKIDTTARMSWQRQLLEAVRRDDKVSALTIMWANKEAVMSLLSAAADLVDTIGAVERDNVAGGVDIHKSHSVPDTLVESRDDSDCERSGGSSVDESAVADTSGDADSLSSP